MTAEAIFDSAIIIKLLKAAKDTPVNFAFVTGGAKDVMAVDRHRAPEQLFQMAKKEGGSTRGTWGTATCSGSKVQFAVEKEIPGLKKLINTWFHQNKLPLKALIGDADQDDDE
jgi:hypothetical protein